jgi:hypothetical protein
MDGVRPEIIDFGSGQGRNMPFKDGHWIKIGMKRDLSAHGP